MTTALVLVMAASIVAAACCWAWPGDTEELGLAGNLFMGVSWAAMLALLALDLLR